MQTSEKDNPARRLTLVRGEKERVLEELAQGIENPETRIRVLGYLCRLGKAILTLGGKGRVSRPSAQRQ